MIRDEIWVHFGIYCAGYLAACLGLLPSFNSQSRMIRRAIALAKLMRAANRDLLRILGNAQDTHGAILAKFAREQSYKDN